MIDLSRREFLTSVASAAVVASFNAAAHAAESATAPTSKMEPVTLRWLEGAPASTHGVTCTVPWPRGQVAASTSLSVMTDAGQPVAAESWPLGYWPDGSLKWTAHALAPLSGSVAGFKVAPGAATPPGHPLVISQSADAIEIDTGVIQCRVPRTAHQ